jgi:hypothetical protein
MVARFLCAAVVGFSVAASAVADEERRLKVVPAAGLGTIESVTVYATKDGKRQSVAEVTKLDDPVALSGEGPFEVMVKPKGGVAVRAAEKLTVKAGETHELKLGEVFGAIEVLGDNLPRPMKVVVTAVKDPGPGQQGHVAIQSATSYRAAMLVPPGTYAVWVVPANGARAQKVEDNVRVQAGRRTKVGD